MGLGWALLFLCLRAMKGRNSERQEAPIIMNNLTSLPAMPYFSPFLSSTLTLTVFLSFTFLREFAKEKERVENKAGYMQLKEREKLDREMNG